VADSPKLLTIHQVCDRLQVSRRTAYNWLSQKKLTSTRTPGGQIRIAESELDSCRPSKR